MRAIFDIYTILYFLRFEKKFRFKIVFFLFIYTHGKCSLLEMNFFLVFCNTMQNSFVLTHSSKMEFCNINGKKYVYLTFSFLKLLAEIANILMILLLAQFRLDKWLLLLLFLCAFPYLLLYVLSHLWHRSIDSDLNALISLFLFRFVPRNSW